MGMLDGIKEKVGPLPIYAWGVIGAVGFAGFLYLTRGPSRTTPAGGTLDSTASPGTGAISSIPDSNSVTLTQLQDELQQLLYQQQQTGGGVSSPGPTTTASDIIASLQTTAGDALSKNAALASTFNAGVAGGHYTSADGDNYQQLFGDFARMRDTFSNSIETQIQILQHNSTVAQAGLSQSDATLVQAETDRQVAALHHQYSTAFSDWQTYVINPVVARNPGASVYLAGGSVIPIPPVAGRAG